MSTYATANFLRKQVRIRDARLSELEAHLEALLAAADTVLHYPHADALAKLSAAVAEASQLDRSTKPEGWQPC
jgi:hypothetical protein